jgi:putative Mn2+ efflux pump MntP
MLSSTSCVDTFVLGTTLNSELKKVRLLSFISAVVQTTLFLIGCLLGKEVWRYTEQIDHWIAFIILSILGLKIVFTKEDQTNEKRTTSFYKYTLKSVAVSIDAIAIGFTTASLNGDVGMLTLTMFLFTFFSVYGGKKLVSICNISNIHKLEIVGGTVLILVGVQILFSHLFDHGFLA